MGIEKGKELDPSLARAITDDNGRVVCSCRGSAREVLTCLRDLGEMYIEKGDEETYECFESKGIAGGFEEIEVEYGAVELTQLQRQCAIGGIQEVTKGFTKKDEYRGKRD